MAIRVGDYIKLADNNDRIVLPQLNRYLIARGDMFPLKETTVDFITRQIATQPRVRSGSFSASSAGRCYRAQELAFLGAPSGDVIDPQLQLIFDDGTWRHMRWQATLLDAGILHTAEFGLPWANMRSMGSMDGLGLVPKDHIKPHWRGKEFGFELKGTNQWTFKKSVLDGAKDAHLDQVHRYFLAGGFDLFVILYEDKDTQQTHEWVYEPDKARLKKQRDELDALNGAIDQQKLHPMLPECKRQLKSGEFGKCAFGGISGACIRAGTWPQLGKAPKRALAGPRTAPSTVGAPRLRVVRSKAGKGA